MLINLLLTYGSIPKRILGSQGKRLKNVRREGEGVKAMKKLVYHVSIILTAVSLFWPVIYSNIPALERVPGNPVLQAIVGLLLFGGTAYLSYDGKNEEKGAEKNDFTAS